MPHLERKSPGAKTSPGARGAVTKALSLYRRAATRMGMRRPKTDGPPAAPDFFSTLGLLLGAAGAEAAGWSCDKYVGLIERWNSEFVCQLYHGMCVA